ncbi:MAG: hypothetical protein LBT66_03670 [Methanobrevibacter sp.]|nr:hypothetical protein [Candidatus Methanovirga meridionalis]
MSKRGPKPSFVNVPCPNKNCKDYGKIGNKNVLGNGTYTNQKKGVVQKYICKTCTKTLIKCKHNFV